MRYWRRRLLRNVVIAAASGVLTLVVFRLATEKTLFSFRFSMAAGYTSTVLIALALVLGPWLARGRRAPVSSDLRRDVGTWGAAYAVLHVVVGLTVHSNGDAINYFFYRPHNGPHLLPVRLDPFGLTNWVGLAATVLLVFLVAISNDRALRALGSSRWKYLQRSTYFAAALVVMHGVVFQLIDHRSRSFVVAFAVIVIPTLVYRLDDLRKRRTSGGTQRMSSQGDRIDRSPTGR